MAADSWLDDETSLDKFLALLLLLLLALAAAVVGSRFLDCGVTGLRSLENRLLRSAWLAEFAAGIPTERGLSSISITDGLALTLLPDGGLCILTRFRLLNKFFLRSKSLAAFLSSITGSTGSSLDSRLDFGPSAEDGMNSGRSLRWDILELSNSTIPPVPDGTSEDPRRLWRILLILLLDLEPNFFLTMTFSVGASVVLLALVVVDAVVVVVDNVVVVVVVVV